MKPSAVMLSVLLSILPVAIAAEPAQPEKHEHEHEHEHEDEFSALGAHVHGKALLTLVLEGNEMQLAFQSAAQSVLGFEHKPRTPEQQQEVASAIAVFNQGQWFTVNPQANCELTMAEASTDLTQANVSGGHADFYANYQLLCQSPARLNAISLTIFNLLPALEQVEVQWIVNGQQGANVATLADSTVRF